LRHAPGAKLLIVGTVRIEELSSEHHLQRLLLDLERDGQVTRIEIGPLSENETASIVEQVAGQPLSPQEAAR
jgi:hypothetical protein